MYNNILVPYDGSDHAQNALHTAIELASSSDKALVTVLKVVDVVSVEDPAFEVATRMAGLMPLTSAQREAADQAYVNENENDIRENIERFFESMPGNVDLKIQVVEGKPADSIVEYALDHKVDCIVMGRRGLGVLSGAIGSVSYAVMRAVDLPIVLVK